MSIEEKRRELFEAWFKQTKPRVAQEMMDDDEFVVRWMFEAYCAALDAVTILLPSPYPSVFYGAEEFADGIEECREFIKENNPLGLKVKP